MAFTHAQLAEGGAGSRGRLHRLCYFQLLEVSLRSQAEPHCILRPPLICTLYAHGLPLPEGREQAIPSRPPLGTQDPCLTSTPVSHLDA